MQGGLTGGQQVSCACIIEHLTRSKPRIAPHRHAHGRRSPALQHISATRAHMLRLHDGDTSVCGAHTHLHRVPLPAHCSICTCVGSVLHGWYHCWLSIGRAVCQSIRTAALEIYYQFDACVRITPSSWAGARSIVAQSTFFFRGVHQMPATAAGGATAPLALCARAVLH